MVERYYTYSIHGSIFLTLGGFIEFFKDSIQERGEDAVWEWFEKWGYDKDLYPVEERTYYITKHSRNVGHLEGIENTAEMNYED